MTFISPLTGFVLGTAPCRHAPCSVLLRTENRGQSWVGLPAPREAVSAQEGNGLWGLRFADADHGYAFGRGLWETENGGITWSRATAPARYVFSLEPVEDHELIAIAGCLSGQGGCSGRFAIYRRAILGGRWQALAGTTNDLLDWSLAVHGSDVWALLGQRLYVSDDGGLSFAAHSEPCAFSRSNSEPQSITTDGLETYLLCTGQGAAGSTAKTVFRTTGIASGWADVGQAPQGGNGGTIAAASNQALVIASSSVASLLYASSDGGRRWQTALTESNDGGVGWADLGFTTSTQGVVIHGPAISDGGGNRPGQLLITEDGGRHWRAAAY